MEFLYHALVPVDGGTLNIGSFNEKMKEHLQHLEEELKATVTAPKDVSHVASEVMGEYYNLCKAWSQSLADCRSVRSLETENE